MGCRGVVDNCNADQIIFYFIDTFKGPLIICLHFDIRFWLKHFAFFFAKKRQMQFR